MNIVLLILSFLGILDSGYLTYEHYNPFKLLCPENGIIDCGKVVKSQYAVIAGVPVALLGVIFYVSVYLATFFLIKYKNSKLLKSFLVVASTGGLLFSIYFVIIQLFVIKAICLYCMFSAVNSTLIFIISYNTFWLERNSLIIWKIGFLYKNIIKKILFLIDPEVVHENMVDSGAMMGNFSLVKKFFSSVLVRKDDRLSQDVLGIKFDRPIGLAAGFDYEAKLTQILPSIGFGFETVGTVTNMPYVGNPKPMLGRLPKSKSLMVNKGFKSSGAKNISKKLSKHNFEYPVGVSIGRTNSDKLKNQRDSVNDIVNAFKTFESRKVNNSYYELNISCPNLIHGKVDFYSPKNLEQLLTAVDKLKLGKPVLIKMPIEKSDKEILEMLKIISNHSPKGVIFGNLQKDRNDKSLVKEEVDKFKVGNFSGKPTFNRSNELIKLCYKKYKKRFVIIGCGGVFNTEDAYRKFANGATLVQLITGMIFEGPQLLADINNGLLDILEKKKLKNISDLIGIEA